MSKTDIFLKAQILRNKKLLDLIRDTFKKRTYTGVHFGFGSFDNFRKATL